MSPITNLEYYLKAFTRLKVDRNRNFWTADTNFGAPYKPVLLLAMLDLLEQGEFQNNLVELTPELVDLYKAYCIRVLPPGKIAASIALPFFHLRSDKFWHLLPQDGKEEILQHTSTVDSAGKLRSLILGARLDDELINLTQLSETRDKLRTALIQTYFTPPVQARLRELAKLNKEAFEYSKKLIEGTQAEFKLKETAATGSFYLPQNKVVRDQGFRRAVVKAYDHRCSLCGIRIVTAEAHTAVNAAHIVPWSYSHNDDPRNGLALCGLCHWAFDEGMTTISKNYTVVLSNQLVSNYYNVPGHLSTLTGRPMILPETQNLWPDLEAIHWHRANIFKQL